jgi:outer membrane protein assembly factor BamB
VWRTPLTGAGLAGIAATSKYVIVADRDLLDTSDVFRCLSAESGVEQWSVFYPAVGELDYGNSPRATPLVHEERVYLLGAFGNLNCVDLETGEILWETDLAAEFGAEVPTWGYCSSPLIVDGRLIVNPGAQEASIVALDPATGEVVWKTPGRPASYSSFIEGTFGGRRQIVGFDADTLGGWDPETGRRLWELKPPLRGDFNVPTPVALGDRLLVTTENNGTRLHAFKPDGTIVPEPLMRNRDLSPDSSTPVVAADLIFGVSNGLHALDATKELSAVWTSDDAAYGDYAGLIAAPGRVLITSAKGELLLVEATADRYRLVSRLRPFAEDVEVHSHPALVGTRLYLRSGTAIICLELNPATTTAGVSD